MFLTFLSANYFKSHFVLNHNNPLLCFQVIVCLLTEEIVIDRGLVKVMDSSFWLKLRPRKEKYLAVEKEIKLSYWPPIENFLESSPIVTSTVSQK